MLAGTVLSTPQAAYYTHFRRDEIIDPDVPKVTLSALAGGLTDSNDNSDDDDANNNNLLTEAGQPMHAHLEGTSR